MRNTLYELNHILNIEKWEELQDQLALVTKMAIITTDYKGNPVTKHSACCPFCQSVRNDPVLGKYCQICDSRAGLEAVRSHKPYIYLCHFDIIDIAIPITIEDKYIGAVMAGQIKISDASRADGFEQLLSSRKNGRAAEHLKKHQHEYDAIPTLTLEEVQNYVQMLFYLSNYIIETSLEKNRVIQTYEILYREEKGLEEDRGLKKSKLAVPHFYAVEPSSKPLRSEVLTPVFDYMEKHGATQVTQAKMAQLCHLSPAYFSRLFSKEMGESFSQYLSRVKIEQARMMLEQTNRPIAQISDELGFSSPGYFIKVFKKQEGITPLLYRKYCQEVNSPQ